LYINVLNIRHFHIDVQRLSKIKKTIGKIKKTVITRFYLTKIKIPFINVCYNYALYDPETWLGYYMSLAEKNVTFPC